MSKKFKFSVIIPIYNVEDYLEETIVSVINQSIGFKDNIEIILVNDGSPDNSEHICIKYKEMYPDNITYIKQENAGVSAARNNGLNYVRGEYVNFLDSDDKWELNAFKEAENIFKKDKEITSIFFPLKFFDSTNKEHFLNKVYKGKYKINILDAGDTIKLQSCSIIIKADIIKDNRYSEKLKISEDAKFITEILIDNPIVGIGKSFYLYRKRKSANSAIQTSTTKETWYLDTPKYCYLHLIDISKKKFDCVLKYIQNLLLYDLKWRLPVNPKIALNDKKTKEYHQLIKKVIENIDDETIVENNLLTINEKMYILNYKYNFKANYILKDKNVYIDNILLFETKQMPIYIDNIYHEKDTLDIYMRFPKINNVLDNIFFKVNNKKIIPDEYELDEGSKNIFNLNRAQNLLYKGAHLKLDLKEKSNIVLCGANNKEEYEINMFFSYTSIFNNTFKSLYLKTKNYIIKPFHHSLVVTNNNLVNRIKNELKVLLRLIMKKKIKSFSYRILRHIHKIIKRKPIWIISDRIQAGGDNGQVFFEYLMNQNIKDTKIYFCINKNTEDYQKLHKKYPKNILKYKSLKHKILYLNADKIISSQADNYVMNLFGQGKYYIADLYNFKFIFLQHGITYNDLSPWLNINHKKIDLIITSSERERKSIAHDYRYNYPEEKVVLTGLSRYDNLINDKTRLKNQIVIMPTWRKKLVSEIDINTGKRIYNPNFKNTDYFKFYNSLINDKKLISYLEKKKLKIKFIPHPNMEAQISDFTKNNCVIFEENQTNYNKEFIENKLLVTDYSSVFFDFSYLHKPLVLAQFDAGDFYEGQLYDKGYFDFEKDGFGRVTKTVEETVETIIKYIENDFKIEKKYENNIDRFYKYHDKNNCKRIYEEINKI